MVVGEAELFHLLFHVLLVQITRKIAASLEIEAEVEVELVKFGELYILVSARRHYIFIINVYVKVF